MSMRPFVEALAAKSPALSASIPCAGFSSVSPALMILATILALSAPPARAQQKGDGPTYKLTTYRCEAPDRATLRRRLQAEAVPQLEQLRARGVLREYLVLVSSVVNRDGWDLAVIVGFEKYTRTAQWEEFERTNPGGLPAPVLALVQPIHEYVADLTWADAETLPKADANSVFLVQESEFENWGNRPAFHQYMDSHEVPLLQKLREQKSLETYRIFENQHYNGEPWDILQLVQYDGLDQFMNRLPALRRATEALAGNARFRVFETTRKQNIQPGRPVVAQAITLP